MMNYNEKPKTYNSPFLKEVKAGINPLVAAKTKERMRFAILIEDLLLKKEWNKKRFAEEMGKSPSLITKWLSGTHNFTIDTLVEIGHVLGEPLLGNNKDENKLEWDINFACNIRSYAQSGNFVAEPSFTREEYINMGRKTDMKKYVVKCSKVIHING